MKRLVKKIFKTLGIHVARLRASPEWRSGKNLNVGSGTYVIDGFLSLDFPTQHYYPKGFSRRVAYDMRNDPLPFADDSVDNIYCSHVIEHIETTHVSRFFAESLRVLKKGGFLRVACPDSKFLWEQTVTFPGYWVWHPKFRAGEDAWLCFIDEVNTARTSMPHFGLERPPEDYSYEELMQALRQGEHFDRRNPSRHINSFDLRRLSDMAREAGFSRVTPSRFQGSSCPALQGPDMDLTHPEMSLYVDFQR